MRIKTENFAERTEDLCLRATPLAAATAMKTYQRQCHKLASCWCTNAMHSLAVCVRAPAKVCIPHLYWRLTQLAWDAKQTLNDDEITAARHRRRCMLLLWICTSENPMDVRTQARK